MGLSILEARLWRCETWFEGCKERGERLWICVGSLKGGWELSEKVDFNWKRLLQKKVVEDILYV